MSLVADQLKSRYNDFILPYEQETALSTNNELVANADTTIHQNSSGSQNTGGFIASSPFFPAINAPPTNDASGRLIDKFSTENPPKDPVGQSIQFRYIFDEIMRLILSKSINSLSPVIFRYGSSSDLTSNFVPRKRTGSSPRVFRTVSGSSSQSNHIAEPRKRRTKRNYMDDLLADDKVTRTGED